MGSFWKNNKNGLIGTLVFHGIILVMILLLGFSPEPTEFPDPDGIVIDFGDSDEGLGDIEPESMETNPVNPTNNENNASETENLVQDIEETVSVEENTNQNNVENPVENETEIEETQPEVNPNALYQGNNNVESEGDSEFNGNKGNPDGADSDNYTGGPTGDNGISYSLTGRAPVGKFPKPDYPPGNIYGKVVINIKVDKYGKVISVSVGKGTTATDERLIVAAKKAAWQVRFNEDYNSIEQTGTITYNFSLK